jgi:hypothetical protein
MKNFYSFNRSLDASRITSEQVTWQGPYAFAKYEKFNEFAKLENIPGVYMFTFDYEDGVILYGLGVSKMVRKRILAHGRNYRYGQYNVLDVNAAKQGVRKEIWHGWSYAKNHKQEYLDNEFEIKKAVEHQLISTKVFIAPISDERKRYRMETAIMQNIYSGKELWCDLPDRGSNLIHGRRTSEIPIAVENITPVKIYGLPEQLEI